MKDIHFHIMKFYCCLRLLQAWVQILLIVIVADLTPEVDFSL